MKIENIPLIQFQKNEKWFRKVIKFFFAKPLILTTGIIIYTSVFVDRGIFQFSGLLKSLVQELRYRLPSSSNDWSSSRRRTIPPRCRSHSHHKNNDQWPGRGNRSALVIQGLAGWLLPGDPCKMIHSVITLLKPPSSRATIQAQIIYILIEKFYGVLMDTPLDRFISISIEENFSIIEDILKYQE